jgi:Skp family chaperone for outer membrane proteins
MGKDKKKNYETEKETDISQIGNVDQIREILFGSQTRELNDRFEKIENSINTIQEEMRRKIEQNQKDINNKIDNELEQLSRKMKNIVTTQQNEFSDVKENAVKQEKRIQNSLDIMEEELNAKNEQLQKVQTQNRDMLRSDIDELREQLLDALNTRIIELTEDKLSRDDAADIMIETAMKIKGTQIEQQLTNING